MLIALTSILLVCFFYLMIIVGWRCKKHATDVNGFVLGGRNVGPWLTAFAFGTSYFSAVIFVGYAGQFGWNFGLASTWIGLGNAFIGSLLAWEILGRRTRIMTRHLDTKTMPDFFEKRFGSKSLKIAASIIVFIFMIPYTASLYNGLSSLFNIVFSIPYWVVIVIMAVLTAIYVIFGGYMATAINDFIQGIIMLVGIVAVILATIASRGGLQSAVAKLADQSAKMPSGETLNGAYASFFGPDPLALLFVVLLTSLGTWGLPQMVGKFYSIKNEDSIKKGTIISTFFAIVVAGGCYFLGGFGRLFQKSEAIKWQDEAHTKPFFDSIVPAMLSELPAVIIAIVIVLVLAASMSTLSSLVLTSSSTLTLDVIAPASKNMNDRKKVGIMRLFIIFFVVISAVLAVLKDSLNLTFIAQMMGVSWGAMAGAFLAPFLYGLYSKKISKASVGVCFIFATAMTIMQLLVSFKVVSFDPETVIGYIFKSSINSGVVSMVGGLILVPIVSLFTPKQDAKAVDAMFACYDQKVMTEVKMRERLEEK
ncbi:MAG: sodium:solute symporter family protein [Lachnospiraceae bacterium]|nr:sodium:solute symporter family protein [Lachnospiraceae bacterium]